MCNTGIRWTKQQTVRIMAEKNKAKRLQKTLPEAERVENVMEYK